MSEMFKNYPYPQKGKRGPNNEHKKLEIEKEFFDDITIGATAKHSFTIPHKLDEIVDVVVTYIQGTEIILNKVDDELYIKEYKLTNDTYCKVKYDISELDSLRFNAYNSNVYAQIKVFLSNGEIEYSPKYKVRIIEGIYKGDVIND